MQTYVVSRHGIADRAAGLEAALTRLRSFEDRPTAGLSTRWLHSYALREADGRFGLLCVFEADGPRDLERHAAEARLPVDEILAVHATLRRRAFAPTMVYGVRRHRVCRDAATLSERIARADRRGEAAMARRVSWLRTYAVDEGDGSVGTVCFLQAVDAQALLDHASRAGLPVDRLEPVIGRIVFRGDDRTVPTRGSAVPV